MGLIIKGTIPTADVFFVPGSKFAFFGFLFSSKLFLYIVLSLESANG